MERVRDADAPLDFFSWHRYSNNPDEFAQCARIVRNALDKYGFYNTESNLNEWNYIRGWTDDFVYSIEQIIGMKGAAFASAVMTLCQSSPVDMLMYYDARPCAFNGLFDFYTFRRLKTYYTFSMFSKLYKAGTQVEVTGDIYNICAIAAKGDDGVYTLITYYSEDDEMTETKEFDVILPDGCHEVYLLDEEHDEECVSKSEGNTVKLSINPNSVVLIKTK